jgi:hypothetical protein
LPSPGRLISTCQSCCVRPCWIGVATTSSRPLRWGRRKSVTLATPTACWPRSLTASKAPIVAKVSIAAV